MDYPATIYLILNNGVPTTIDNLGNVNDGDEVAVYALSSVNIARVSRQVTLVPKQPTDSTTA